MKFVLCLLLLLGTPVMATGVQMGAQGLGGIEDLAKRQTGITQDVELAKDKKPKKPRGAGLGGLAGAPTCGVPGLPRCTTY